MRESGQGGQSGLAGLHGPGGRSLKGSGCRAVGTPEGLRPAQACCTQFSALSPAGTRSGAPCPGARSQARFHRKLPLRICGLVFFYEALFIWVRAVDKIVLLLLSLTVMAAVA